MPLCITCREHFTLHEIIDSCETLFQRFCIRANDSGYPVRKRNAIPWNDLGFTFE